jgi:hypothetical protein
MCCDTQLNADTLEERVSMFHWQVALALMAATHAYASLCGAPWQFPCTGNQCNNGTVWYSPGTLSFRGCDTDNI